MPAVWFPVADIKTRPATQREDPCNVCDMFSIVAIVTNWLIAAAGVYAVFQIVNGRVLAGNKHGQ